MLKPLMDRVGMATPQQPRAKKIYHRDHRGHRAHREEQSLLFHSLLSVSSVLCVSSVVHAFCFSSRRSRAVAYSAPFRVFAVKITATVTARRSSHRASADRKSTR